MPAGYRPRRKAGSAGKSRRGRSFAAAALILAGTGALLLYGPFEQFRLLWINTAMYSSHYQFLAAALYPRSYIASVLERNRGGAEGKSSPEPLVPGGKAGTGEEPVVTEIRGTYYRGYLVKISDPARLSLAVSPRREGSLLEELTAAHRAAGGINAAGFADDRARGLPSGMLIMDGEVMNRCVSGRRHVMGGFREDYKLIVGAFTEAEIAAQGYRWAFEFGPLLIVNGEKTGLNAFSGGLSPRTAIGQTPDGAVLLVVIDGRQPASIGATYQEVQTVLYDNGAVNAIGLDGGSSSTLVLGDRVINSPSGGDDERLLPNGIIF
jgi:exopolysaccharide biosynthesis protein